MIKVNVEVSCKPWLKKIRIPKKYFDQKLRKISKKIPLFKRKNIIFTILLTDSLKIKKLNKKFRNRNKATDVLSFPYFFPNKLKLTKKEYTYIGDIATCYEITQERANKNNFTFEFDKLWVHGLLHLLGFNHIKNKDYIKMNKIEKKILSIIN